MGAGRLLWFMLRQRLPQSSPKAIPDLPPTRVIRGEDPQCLLDFLGRAGGLGQDNETESEVSNPVAADRSITADTQNYS